MARSERHVDRYTDIRRETQDDVDREKAVQDEIDAAAKRYRRKELACKLAICAIYLGLGILAAVVIYVKGL